MGILPATVVPLEVLAIGGPVETAHFGIASSVLGLLVVIPSTLSVVLFAEASRSGESPERQLRRKALRGMYMLLLPASAFVIAFGPFMLRIFGASYASADAGCVRVLALSALPMAGNYLVDSLLLVRDRIGAYVFMNGVNAALVLGGVALLLPYGLTGAAAGLDAGSGAVSSAGAGRARDGQEGTAPPHGQAGITMKQVRNLVSARLDDAALSCSVFLVGWARPFRPGRWRTAVRTLEGIWRLYAH